MGGTGYGHRTSYSGHPHTAPAPWTPSTKHHEVFAAGVYQLVIKPFFYFFSLYKIFDLYFVNITQINIGVIFVKFIGKAVMPNSELSKLQRNII